MELMKSRRTSFSSCSGLLVPTTSLATLQAFIPDAAGPTDAARRGLASHTSGPWNVSSYLLRPGRPGCPERRRIRLSSDKYYSDEPTIFPTRPCTPRLYALSVVLLSLLLFIRGTEAAGLKGDRQRSALEKPSEREAQLVDPNAPSESRMRLEQRDVFTSTVIVTTTRALLPSRVLGISSTANAHGSGSATVVAAPSTSSSVTDPDSSSNSPLPQPFDTSLGNNFTNTACPNFFDSFLSDANFQQCYPFSLLLQVR